MEDPEFFLVNPLARPLPKLGPLTTNGIESNYRMSPDAHLKHKAMAVVPNPSLEPIVKQVERPNS